MSLFTTHPKPSPVNGDRRIRRTFFIVKCLYGECRWFGFDGRVQMYEQTYGDAGWTDIEWWSH